MKIPSYLQRNRYGIFHFRRAVPIHLRDVIGKREVIHTLKTRDPRKAVHLSRLFAIQADRLFQEVSMSKDDTIRTNWMNKISLPDGTTIEQETDHTEVIELKKAGFSTDDIKELLQASAPQHSQHVREATPEPSNDIKLSDLIEKYNQHCIDERSGDWEIPSGDKAKLRRLIEIIGADRPEKADRVTVVK